MHCQLLLVLLLLLLYLLHCIIVGDLLYVVVAYIFCYLFICEPLLLLVLAIVVGAHRYGALPDLYMPGDRCYRDVVVGEYIVEFIDVCVDDIYAEGSRVMVYLRRYVVVVST